MNQEVAAALLRKRGHDVTIVDNGREAVDAAVASSFDVILMDVQMPELDGFAATAEIRHRIIGGLPIVAVTANALPGERERCEAAGMDGFLAKPFKPHELFAAVEQCATLTADMHRDGSAPAPEPAESEQTPVDLVNLRRTMKEAGAEDAVQPMLQIFMEDSPKRLGALAEAVTAGEAEDIERAAHAFKSAAGTIGAKSLAAFLSDLESKARNGTVGDAPKHLANVQRECEAVLTYLESATAAETGSD